MSDKSWGKVRTWFKSKARTWEKCLLVVTVLLFWTALAHAQTPEDVRLKRVGGLYEIVALWPPEPDAVNVCCARVDAVPVLDLGCATARDTRLDPNGVSLTIATLTVAIPKTVRDDAEVRCTSADADGNVSDPSPNAGIADFTPPSPPVPLRRQ